MLLQKATVMYSKSVKSGQGNQKRGLASRSITQMEAKGAMTSAGLRCRSERSADTCGTLHGLRNACRAHKTSTDAQISIHENLKLHCRTLLLAIMSVVDTSPPHQLSARLRNPPNNQGTFTKFTIGSKFKDYHSKKHTLATDDYHPSNDARRWSKSPWTAKVNIDLSLIISYSVACANFLPPGR